MADPAKSRWLCVVPSFYGWSGDAVNERQLVTTLAREVDKCYVLTIISLRQLLSRRSELKVDLPGNMSIFAFPLLQPHILLSCFALTGISCIVGIVSLMLYRLKKIDFIYVRTSILAMGILTFRALSKKTIVKMAEIVEDEIQSGVIIKSSAGRLASVLDRLTLAKAKRVAVGGTGLYYEIIRRRSFQHESEALEITPGVDLHVIQKIRRQHGRALPKTGNIGFLGTMHWWQGTILLAEAASILSRKIPNTKLLFLGDGPLRKETVRVCEREGIRYELSGYLSHEETLKRLASLDVMVSPTLSTSTTDGIVSLKIIEAWALGIPVVATKRKALTDTYENCKDIIYCDPNPKSIAGSVELLLENENLRLRLAERGPELARHFSYDKIVDKLLAASFGGCLGSA